MAHIAIYVTDVQRNGSDETQFDVAGHATSNAGDGNVVVFNAAGINFTAAAATVNAAIVSAAIAAMAAVDITIGVLDNRTLVGGAVGV